jgi:hypothetical protein
VFYDRNYRWPVIEQKYLDMFCRLASTSPTIMEPSPGWLARRTRQLPPAAQVVDALPRGMA